MSWRCALASLLLAAPASASEPCRDANPYANIPEASLIPMWRGYDRPRRVLGSGDGSGRLFIVEQAGVVRVIDGGKRAAKPFLDIRDRVRDGGELGLLGLAFHPDFKDNGRFFAAYSSKSKGGLRTVISEFSAAKAAESADPKTERELIVIPQPYAENKSGSLAFGPDGLLYIGVGDGGGKTDPEKRAQNKDTALGKILRIDVDHPAGRRPYSIPRDNPFPRGLDDGGAAELYAWGFRDPSLSFDAATGVLYAADPGPDFQEIDAVEKTKNYGWRVMEGTHCTPGVRLDCSSEGFEPPILDYGPKDGRRAIGGVVYRGRDVPGLCGTYVFADADSGRVWGLIYGRTSRRVLRQRLLTAPGLLFSAIGEDDFHEVYLADRDGNVMKLSRAQR